MPFTIPIVATVLIYTWLVEPIASGWMRPLPAIAVLGLAIAHALKRGDWGVQRSAVIPATREATVLTLSAVGVFALAGMVLETIHARENPVGDLAFLLIWGGGQQFVLQTVVLHEAETISRHAPLLAASIFATLHLPNPFLSAVTFVGAFFWCRIFARHPNILPLALSTCARNTRDTRVVR
jgi:hypothetical protein